MYDPMKATPAERIKAAAETMRGPVTTDHQDRAEALLVELLAVGERHGVPAHIWSQITNLAYSCLDAIVITRPE